VQRVAVMNADEVRAQKKAAMGHELGEMHYLLAGELATPLCANMRETPPPS
jgi:hypothetical protein